MKDFLRTGGTLVLFSSLSAPLLAQPINPNAQPQFNWNQTTGLINIPIARSLPRGTFFGAFDFKSQAFKDLFSSEFLASPGDHGNGSFHLMFSPIKNVEIAVMGLHDVNRGGNVNTLGRLLRIPPAQDFSTAIKWVVAEETQDMPSIAVGVENLTYPYPVSADGKQEAITNIHFREKGFYAVGSKSFPVGDQLLSVHLGVGTGRFQNHPFGGLEYTFENGLALIGEYDGWQGSYGLRYTGLRNLRVTMAVQGNQPTFQIGYLFNPFDLLSDGDQDDYNPYAMPAPHPEEPARPDQEPVKPDQQPAKPDQEPAKPDQETVTPDDAPAKAPEQSSREITPEARRQPGDQAASNQAQKAVQFMPRIQITQPTVPTVQARPRRIKPTAPVDPDAQEFGIPEDLTRRPPQTQEDD